MDDSHAYALGNYPQTEDRNTALYSEESLVGYRWFDTQNIVPMYSFGHGLSYTEFIYNGLHTDNEEFVMNDTIRVRFELTNSGKTDGDEVVQLYVHHINSQVKWPVKELKAFQRVSLKSRETQIVELSVPVSKLRYWDEEKYDWILETGEIELIVGSSASDIRLKKNVKII